MIKFLSYVWQLPQNIVGLLYLVILKWRNTLVGTITAKGLKDDETSIYFKESRGCVSLGCYVFLSQTSVASTTLKHELGHHVQSKMLGPLYLIVIGLPSILWAGLRRLGLFKSFSYYAFYTERWADNIAKIKR